MGEGGVEPQPVTPTDSSAPDLVALLKVLKADVPRFTGQNIHNWIYTIEKFFSLHAIPFVLRL